MEQRTYIAIDLKSFYASVEVRERNLDPLTTNLVVADESRTQKTICLAVSPALKSYGIPGRPRLFQVVQKVKDANAKRKTQAPSGTFTGKSCDFKELEAHPELAIDYIIAPPRMAYYMEYSTKIYQIYLKYVAPEDIHVYSIDEVLMDVTQYLSIYHMTPHELAMTMIRDVLAQTGITATAGIGTNLYLCKIAMDIVAKHMPPDEDGVRIAELDEISYRKLLWGHLPITDFWRVGKGYQKRLEEVGILTMGDVARCSLGGPEDYYNEELLYDIFGVNAELLIDHAWGYEPCMIRDIKAYKPQTNSLGSGQVLKYPYSYEKARLVIYEMADDLVLEMVEKGMVTDQIVMMIGYDVENIRDDVLREKYEGPVVVDQYGREVPKPATGSQNLNCQTSSFHVISEAVLKLFDRICDRELLIRRLNLTAAHVVEESKCRKEPEFRQLDLFADFNLGTEESKEEKEKLEREKKMQEAVLSIKKKFGSNALMRGMNLIDGATAIERNGQIGGHKK